MSEANDAAYEVLRLLRQRGAEVTVTRPGAGTFDPDTQTETTGTPSTFTALAVLAPYDESSVDNTRIYAEDRKAYVEATDSGLNQGDRVAYGGDTWEVLTVRTYELQGTVLAHVAQLRTGGGQ